jgi:hypothetical protein
MGGLDQLRHAPDDDIPEDERGLDDLQRPPATLDCDSIAPSRPALMGDGFVLKKLNELQCLKKILESHSGSSILCNSIRNVRIGYIPLVVLLSLIKCPLRTVSIERGTLVFPLSRHQLAKSPLKHGRELPD